MQIDVFPAYADQKVGAMIMAIAIYRGAPAGVQRFFHDSRIFCCFSTYD
jgi:hypothetical protein